MQCHSPASLKEGGGGKGAGGGHGRKFIPIHRDRKMTFISRK